MEKLPIFKQVPNMPTKRFFGPCQQVVLEGDAVDLDQIPIQHCWPGDGALVTRG